MKRSALNLTLAVLALVLVSAALWQWRQRQAPPQAVVQRSDYVLRDFELTTLDDEGQESFTVRGPYLQRDVGGKSISLVQPRFAFPGSDSDRWQARADAAWVSPSADQVHLIGAVRMDGPASPAGVGIRFETDRLVVFPDESLARTPQRVTVTHGDSILTGTGLEADLQARRFQLLNDVKGRYAPRGP